MQDNQLFASTEESFLAFPSKRCKLPNITYCMNSIKKPRHNQAQEAGNKICTGSQYVLSC